MNNEIPDDVKEKLQGKSIDSVVLKVVYKNWRDVTENRRIIPIEFYYGSNEYHKEEQWLMKVWDIDKNAYRDYALKGIIGYW